MYKGVQCYHLWKIIINYESFLYFFYHSRIVHICHALYLIPAWKFQYFFQLLYLGKEKKFDIKSSTIFSTKPLEIWLNTPTWTWTHNLWGIWNLCHSVQRKCTNCTKVYKITLCEWFQYILNHFFIFLITQGLYTYVIHFI